MISEKVVQKLSKLNNEERRELLGLIKAIIDYGPENPEELVVEEDGSYIESIHQNYWIVNFRFNNQLYILHVKREVNSELLIENLEIKF